MIETNNNIVDEEQTLKKVAPFSAEFVMKITIRNMTPSIRKANKAIETMCHFIDRSIEITLRRVSDFEGDTEKSNEIFKTLSDLHALRKQVTSNVLFKDII